MSANEVLNKVLVEEEENNANEPSDFRDIKKNLLSDLSDEAPEGTKFMAPPPLPSMGDNSEKMKVFLRIRPLSISEISRSEEQGCVVVRKPTQVDLIAPKDSRAFEHTTHGCGKLVNSFTFSHVYRSTTTQKEFFDGCVQSTVKDFIEGQNCLMFAYGVTNSGKTFTMQGPPKDAGVIPRSMEMIFNSIENKQLATAELKPYMYTEVKRLSPKELTSNEKFKSMLLNVASRMGSSSDADLYSSNESLASQSSLGECSVDSLDDECVIPRISTENQGNVKFSVWVSFAEVYNEQVYDLLEPLGKNNQKRKIMQLREDKSGNPYIKDLKQVHCSSAEEAVKILAFGQKNLQYACTKLNESSSRSHCIFKVSLLRVIDKANPHVARLSMLSFCDLAGSERHVRTQSHGERLKEAANINTSLLTLGRCIQLLRQNQQLRLAQQRVVPFRESKLTRLFQNFFTGKGKASMIVNVSPAASSFDENVQALKFSAIAQQVQFITEKPVEPAKTKSRTGVSIALAKFEENSLSRPSIQWGTDEDAVIDEPTQMEGIQEEDGTIESECTYTEEEDDEFMKQFAVNQAMSKLRAALVRATNDLRAERQAKKELEVKLRKEICEEMMTQMTHIEQQYEEQIEEERARHEEFAEKKIAIFQEALDKSVKRRNKMLDDVRESTVSLAVFQAEKVKLEQRDAEITKLQAKLANEENANASTSTVITENEIFINVTTQLKEAKDVLIEKDNEIAELQQTLGEAGETFEQRDREIQILQTERSEYMKNLEQLRKELEEANAVRKSVTSALEQKILDHEGTIAKLEVDIQGSIPELASAKVEISQLRTKIAEFTNQQKISDVEGENRVKIEELEQEVLAVSRGLQASVREKEDVEKQYNDCQAKLEEVQFAADEQKIELEAHCSEVTSKIEKLQAQLRRKSVEAQGDLSTIQTQLLSAKCELERERKDKTGLEEKLTLYQKEMMELRSENQCDGRDEIIKQLEVTKIELQLKASECESFKSKIQEMKEKCSDQANVEIENLRQMLSNAQTQKEVLEKQVTSLKRELGDLLMKLSNDKSAAELEIKTQTQLLSSIQETSDVLKQEKHKLEKSLECNLVELLESQQRTNSMNEEMERMKHKFEQTNACLDEVKCNSVKYETLMSKQKIELDALQAERGGLKEENSNMWSELHSAKVALTAAENDCVANEAKTERLATRIASLTSESDKLKKENTQLMSEITNQEKTMSLNEVYLEKLNLEMEHTNQEHNAALIQLEKGLSENYCAELSKLNEELSTCRCELVEERKKCEKFADMGKRVSDLNDKLDEQKILHNTALTKLKNVIDENKMLKELRKRHETEISKSSVTISTLEKELEGKDNKAESLQVILDARQKAWNLKEDCHSAVKLELQQAMATDKSLRAELAKLSRDYSKQSDELSQTESKLQSNKDEALVTEKDLLTRSTDLHFQVMKQEGDIASLREQLEKDASSFKEKYQEKEKAIDELKKALDEQEATMKVQDEFIESKEEQLKELIKESHDWQKKCEGILNDQTGKFSQQLNTVQSERDFLKEMQTKMMNQIGTLNQQVTKLKSENSELSSQLDELKIAKNKKGNDNSQAILLKERQNELVTLKAELAVCLRDKEDSVSKLELELQQSKDIIRKCESKTTDEVILMKEEVIVQLEKKIRDQEQTINNLTGGGRTTRTSTRLRTEDQRKLQFMEQELSMEKSKHAETQLALNRVHKAKDEQVADLKEANQMLQRELDRYEKEHKRPRKSDKFNEPMFVTDQELSASTCELDVTPYSAKKKTAMRRSARKTQKDNLVSSYAKKLLVNLSPMRMSPKQEMNNQNTENSESAVKTRRRRKLYTGDDVMAMTSPHDEDVSKKSVTDVHGIVKRSLRSLNLK